MRNFLEDLLDCSSLLGRMRKVHKYQNSRSFTDLDNDSWFMVANANAATDIRCIKYT